MLKGIDTSGINYIQALSPTAITVAGSTNAVDLSLYTHGTLVFVSGSTAAATIAACVLRSGTSNGTFNGLKDAASISAAVLGKTHARSFTANSSAVWHKVYYTQTGSGSPVCTILLIASGGREAPIDQNSNTTSYSVVTG